MLSPSDESKTSELTSKHCKDRVRMEVLDG
jgi:hypothetical protein